MEFTDIRIGAVLKKNAGPKNLYLVKNLAARSLFLEDESGAEVKFEFRGQFELAGDDEKRGFSENREKRISRKREKSSNEHDERETLARFDEYVAALKIKHPEIVPKFMAFWSEVVAIIGGRPGQTWRMRNSRKYGLNPMIRVGNPTTGNWVDGMYISAASPDGMTLNLTIMRGFRPKDCDPLFPQKKTFHGQGDGIDLPYATMTGETLKPYLDCIRIITARKNSP